MRKHNFPLNVFIIFVSIATTELSSPNNRLTSQCHETKTMTENIVCCFDFHEELEMHAIHILFLCVCVNSSVSPHFVCFDSFGRMNKVVFMCEYECVFMHIHILIG